MRIAPRGGGTGTNGQSLTDGLVVDVSRHMNRILEINAAERWVRVEAGVVKDQLNAALAPHGLFFAPELSTSNRATIGGMVSTDASGQGSCLYGKTRDHVLALTTVLADGTVWHSHPLADDALREVQRRGDRVGAIHRAVDAIEREHREEIAARFPRLNRCLTGYDLAHIRTRDGRFDLNAVLCGSEGTLGILAEATLNLLPIPKHSVLVNLRYGSFDAALRDARALMEFGPASIETVDSKVLALAQQDIVWEGVRQFFPDDASGPARGVNLIEFVGDTEAEVEAPLQRLTAALAADPAGGRLGHTVARGEAEVAPRLGDAQACRRAARRHAGRAAADRLRRGHGGPAGASGGLHRRVPRPARCARAGLRHVRPCRCRGAACPPGHRHEGPGAGGDDPRGHRCRGRPDAEIRRPALGRARQGRPLGVFASLLRPALPAGPGGEGGLRPAQPAQSGQDRHARRQRAADGGRRADPRPGGPQHPRRGKDRLRRGDALQRQRRLLRLGPGRGHVPVLEGDAGPAALAEGPGDAGEGVAAPPRRRRYRPGGRKPVASAVPRAGGASPPASATPWPGAGARRTSRTR